RDSLNFNFAIRMAIGVAIAMAIGNYFNLEKSMWIGLTVMSLTEPHFDQTKEKIKYRLFGTFLGALIFMIIFKFVIPKSLTIYVVLLLNYTYMFIKEYKARMVFTTMNALGATMVLYDISVSVPMRISFILGGTVIAFIVNKVLYDRFIKKDKKLITYIYD
ncbi:FUSC family protein, partial [Clostridium sp.]|uniref:FUSC family protein n=1 Tax=Clostridium sp. TaxID=1506 RepID=UPI002624ED3D